VLIPYDCELLTELNEPKNVPNLPLTSSKLSSNGTKANSTPEPQSNITPDKIEQPKFYMAVSNLPINVTDEELSALSKQIVEVHNNFE